MKGCVSVLIVMLVQGGTFYQDPEFANLREDVTRAHLESKHDSFGLDADLRHKEFNQLIDERFAVWKNMMWSLV